MNIRKKILEYKTQKFNLLNFRKEVESIRDNAALIVISKDNIFKLKVSNFEIHQETMKKVLKALKINYLFFEFDMTWAEDISKYYDLVIIRIIRDFDIIYFPEHPNNYQLDEFKKYYDETKKIDELLNSKRDIKLFNYEEKMSFEYDIDELMSNLENNHIKKIGNL